MLNIYKKFFINRSINHYLIRVPNSSYIKRYMLSSAKKGTTSYKLIQQTFLKFCDEFVRIQKEIPNINLAPEAILVNPYKELFTKHDYYCNRVFQLAFECVFQKHIFNRAALLKCFNNTIPIKDYINSSTSTLGEEQQSTAYNLFLADKVKAFHPDVEVVVFATPASSDITKAKMATYSKELQEFLNRNQKLTGNKFPDYFFNGEPYDGKYAKKVDAASNHVYNYPNTPEGISGIKSALNSMVSSLKTRYEEIPITTSNLAEKKTRGQLVNLHKKLQKFQQDLSDVKTNEEFQDIVHQINVEIIKRLDDGCDFGVPLLILGKHQFTPSTTVSSPYDFPEGRVDQLYARKAIAAILGSQNIQSSAKNAMQSALHHLEHTDSP